MNKIFTLFVAVWAIAASYAAPARPGWRTKTQPDGTTIEVQLVGDECHHYWVNRDGQRVQADNNGYWQVLAEQYTPATHATQRKAAARRISQQKMAKAPAMGSPKGLVILVNFQNYRYQEVNTQSAMNDLMNSDQYTYDGAIGSVRQYFSDQSNGQYTPVFDVIGPVTLPYDMAYYGGNANGVESADLRPGDMVVEACSIANELHNVDFTQYDNDKDGYVDFVYVLYAGMGEADGGAANTIWPHAWDLESAEFFGNCSYNNEEQRIFDGMRVKNYACSGELSSIMEGQVATGITRTGIGTIAHEFSHVIGLQDLYDTSYGQNYKNYMTPGAWHIMDEGSYNNNGKTPPSYTIYDKYYLGWETPVNPGNEAQVLTMAAGKGYQIASSNELLSATTTNAVYYIENRQKQGWDAHLPGHGLLIWKIMYNPIYWRENTTNSIDGTVCYALISATGQTIGIGTDADAFPGSTNTTSWTGLMGKELTNINESNGVITLNYIDEVSDEPKEIHVEGMQYANAFYNDSTEYYYFELYKDENQTTGELICPEIDFIVVAKSKTAINGTYDILKGYCSRSAGEKVEIDTIQPASVTIQHVNDKGDYSMRGSFVGTDGINYSFDAVVHVTAKDTDNYYSEITLDESTTPTRVENTDGRTAATHKILRNGQLLIITHESIYKVDGQKMQ